MTALHGLRAGRNLAARLSEAAEFDAFHLHGLGSADGRVVGLIICSIRKGFAPGPHS